MKNLSAAAALVVALGCGLVAVLHVFTQPAVTVTVALPWLQR